MTLALPPYYLANEPSWVFFMILILVLIFMLYVLLKIMMDSSKNKEDLKDMINSSFSSNFINLSEDSEKLVKFAVEYWRLRCRISDQKTSFDEVKSEKLEKSLDSMYRCLVGLDIGIRSRQGEKYNDGLNLEILDTTGDTSQKYAYIKETIEPEISIKGRVARKEKVLVEYGNQEKET